MEGQGLSVRFENPDFIVVDKPAGIHTAPLRTEETGTLIDMVIRSYPEVAALPGIKPLEPGLVHRLDRDTSGLVVIARTAQAFDALRRMFATGGARKDYVAACACSDEGGNDDTGADDGAGAAGHAGRPMRIESRFAPYGRGRRMVRPVLAGEKSHRLLKSASTESYVTEARVTARADGRAMVAASILRGFRHQVRAHLAFLGYLILGDPLYGTAVPAGFAERMYLHAARISMSHPSTGLPLVVEAPLPAEFDGIV
jgi:23S rRNA pseudouridine1911/1915/1917 synthase